MFPRLDDTTCVFHLRTDANAKAAELQPLSALKDEDPEAYAQALAKYADTPERRRLPTTVIPLLEALWTEVVFLSPIHPRAIHRAWREIGGVDLPDQEFWAIPARALPTAVIFDRTITRTGDPIDAGEVQPFDPVSHRARRRTTVPNEDWIRTLTARRHRGAFFHGTPHVLTRGPVALDQARIIRWRG